MEKISLEEFRALLEQDIVSELSDDLEGKLMTRGTKIINVHYQKGPKDNWQFIMLQISNLILHRLHIIPMAELKAIYRQVFPKSPPITPKLFNSLPP